MVVPACSTNEMGGDPHQNTLWLGKSCCRRSSAHILKKSSREKAKSFYYYCYMYIYIFNFSSQETGKWLGKVSNLYFSFFTIIVRRRNIEVLLLFAFFFFFTWCFVCFFDFFFIIFF